jgi:hypothetical protein
MADAQSAAREEANGGLSMTDNKPPFRVPLSILAGIITLALLGASRLRAQDLSPNGSSEEPQAVLEPAPPGLTGEAVFQGLVEHSRLRDQLLERYSVVRTYKLGNTKGKIYAQAVVEVQYRAPGEKIFTTKSENGGPLSKWVLGKLIGAEAETAKGKQHRDSSIAPHNYSFRLLGEQQVGPYRCYVAEAIPRRKDKYLFRGRIWISQSDFGIVKISGEPASKLSFWIERVHFVRQYEKVGMFWLPRKDSTVAKVRFGGSKTFTIAHADYSINGEASAATKEELRSPSNLMNDIHSSPGRSGPVTKSQSLALTGTAKGNAVGDAVRFQANSNSGRD